MQLLHPTTHKDVWPIIEQAANAPNGPGILKLLHYHRPIFLKHDGEGFSFYSVDGNYVKTPSPYELISLLQFHWGEWLAEQGVYIGYRESDSGEVRYTARHMIKGLLGECGKFTYDCTKGLRCSLYGNANKLKAMLAAAEAVQ